MLLLRPKPSFLLKGSSWLISVPATHFFSSEPCIEDGGGKGSPLKSSSSSSAVDKVELTKTLLRRYGFTNTHLSKLYNDRPSLFKFVIPEKTLLPKLDFYRDTIGFSNTDLPRFICSNPSLLACSFQNQIVPCYTFIKALLSSSDDEIVLNTLKRNTRILTYSVDKRIAPNIAALTAAGVPHKQILYLMRRGPSVLVSLSLGESIKRAAEMGLDPNKLSFVQAITMFTQMSKSTWDKKIEVYRKCGLSDAQIFTAFRSFPLCMSLAEENIEQTMDFVVKKMGWNLVDLARNPAVLGCSLEKRIIPRCTVVRYLQGKELLRKNIGLSTFLKSINEKDFIDRFVKKYEDDVPDLMDIYLGKISAPPPQEPIP